MDYQKYIYWQDGDMWLGYLERYPDYWTQGETQEELRENLRDIYGELTGGHIPCVREAAVLESSVTISQIYNFTLANLFNGVYRQCSVLLLRCL